MLSGSLWSSLITYTIPIMLTGLLQLLFNAADLVIVGRFSGSINVAAVSATGAITNLIVNLFIGLSVGAGVAVAGAFSLVRFRSVPGTAKEICTLFLAMGAGLIAGMGYLGFAALFTLVMCMIFLLYNHLDFGSKKNAATYKTFTIVIPEDLDYTGVFDDIFNAYTTSFDLTRVKSTNMGSMFKLTYNVVLRDITKEKEMIDKIRCRNGNLEITVSKQETTVTEL